MVRTRVGYAGGTTPHPTYTNIGDHAEAIEIEYDPAVIGYQDLLGIFWQAHDPNYRSYTRQYRGVILWSGDEQRRLAEKSAPRGAATAIEPLVSFTPAEDYHQKYYLRSSAEIASAFHRIYPNERDFAASTAAARVNGYLGGHGGPERLAEEAENLGLTGAARAELERIVGKMHPSETCVAPLRTVR